MLDISLISLCYLWFVADPLLALLLEQFDVLVRQWEEEGEEEEKEAEEEKELKENIETWKGMQQKTG